MSHTSSSNFRSRPKAVSVSRASDTKALTFSAAAMSFLGTKWMTSAIYNLLAAASMFFAEAHHFSNCKNRAVVDGRDAGTPGCHQRLTLSQQVLQNLFVWPVDPSLEISA